MTHRIRLRAGWIRQTGPLLLKVGLPDDHVAPPGDAVSETVVHYRRPFNCPTGLSAETAVDLVVDGWTGMLRVRLDDAPLAGPLAPSEAPLRVAVADRLRGHHQVTIELSAAEEILPRLTGIVFLEIHD